MFFEKKNSQKRFFGLISSLKFFNISKLLKKDLRCIIKDRNGYYRILGLYNGLECESIKASVGTSKNSLNGYTIALKGQEEQESLYINDLVGAGFTI
jgi:hypothetical protein